MVSGGQQQRAAIARALATDPPLLVADEPTGNLDAKTAQQVFELFMRLVEEQGKTMLMVTHDQELAGRIPRKVEIVNGRIANDMRTQPKLDLFDVVVEEMSAAPVAVNVPAGAGATGAYVPNSNGIMVGA
jgi:ABC-type lipoprotein export system ATPase subunit